MNDTDITNKTIYLCDDTIEGIFTAIYKAWGVSQSLCKPPN